MKSVYSRSTRTYIFIKVGINYSMHDQIQYVTTFEATI